jgi:hemerythrin
MALKRTPPHLSGQGQRRHAENFLLGGQRQDLVSLLHAACDEFERKDRWARLSEMVSQIEEYTAFHLEYEEYLLRGSECPNIEACVAQHGKWRREVQVLGELVAERNDGARDVLACLVRSFNEHTHVVKLPSSGQEGE